MIPDSPAEYKLSILQRQHMKNDEREKPTFMRDDKIYLKNAAMSR